MADPKLSLSDSCPPVLKSGTTLEITASQTLAGNRLTTTAPDTVKFLVEGPRLELVPDQIVGVYPAPGSVDSPDEFLPHVALARRTLPWERRGPSLSTPWLALLLLKESEIASARAASPQTLEHVTVKAVEAKDPIGYNALRTVNKLSDNAPLHVLYVPTGTLREVLPRTSELPRLCHMKRVESVAGTQDVSIVLCNRLPDAGAPGQPAEKHVALLVSLEGRGDAYNRWFGQQQPPGDLTVLVVLHHWTFTPSTGGDFEQVMQAIAYRPNGGVLRFGNLPRTSAQPPLSGGFDAALNGGGFPIEPLPDTAPWDVIFRGPIRPFPVGARSQGFAVRSAPEEFAEAPPGSARDYSHAAAFQLGQLLALNDPSTLEDLHDVRSRVDPVEVPLRQNDLPVALQKIDWVVNEPWFEDRWKVSLNDNRMLIKDVAALGSFGKGDWSGLEETIGPDGSVIIGQLEKMPMAPASPVAAIDFAKATGGSLGKQFPLVKTVGLS